jgi:hypothetical protein
MAAKKTIAIIGASRGLGLALAREYDPRSMMLECVAGTGISQIIGRGVADHLAKGNLIDLLPGWHGERFPLFAFHPSRQASARQGPRVRRFLPRDYSYAG